MTTYVRDRIGAAMGAIFVVMIFLGSTLSTAGTDQSAHPSGAHVLRDALHQHSSTSAGLGNALEALGYVAFFGLLGYVADLLRRRDGGKARIPTMTVVVAGVVAVAVKLSCYVPSAALIANRHTLSPEVAQVLNDLNNGGFVLSWLPFAVFVGTLALGLRDVAAVGRPTAYLGAACGVIGVVLALLGVNDITNANPVGFLLGMLWLLIVCVRLVVKPVSPIAYDAVIERQVAVSV